MGQIRVTVVPYTADSQVRDFVRSLAALPFLPINKLEAALDMLEDVSLDKDSPYYDDFEKKKLELTDYIERIWIRYSLIQKFDF